MMVSRRMEQITIVAVVMSFMIWVMECSPIEGRTLNPIYWNSSNPMFRSGSQTTVDVALHDKLDIICPRRGRNDGEKLFYFKLYLVSENHFKNCSAVAGRRLINCDVPNREKKYTFYFQDLSPSPWGLEFEADKAYYVLSTSSGDQDGIDREQGGACKNYNMKIELKVHSKPDSIDDSNNVKPAGSTPSIPVVRPPVITVESQPNVPASGQPSSNNNNQGDGTNNNNNSNNVNTNNEVSNNGLVIGIVLGACAVLFVVLIAFLGYKVYRRRRHMKKYQSPPMTPTRGSTPLQQVTLLPIAPASHHGHHHHHHGRLHSESDRHRSATLTSDMRPPPSYNESFLDNGGPVVAV